MKKFYNWPRVIGIKQQILFFNHYWTNKLLIKYLFQIRKQRNSELRQENRMLFILLHNCLERVRMSYVLSRKMLHAAGFYLASPIQNAVTW
jgi:hypothetical protein